MPPLAAQDLDISRLLFDLKRCAEVVNGFMGQLDADAIAAQVTDGLIKTFGCVFARIWLVEPDRSALRLVASSGLSTQLNGSFARVPMGAFKVGKIAQHCIPFLSNCLPEESWVKDRNWAIANQIQGFAGLPLMVENQAIGVLAVFSVKPMDPEFLEALQMLSLSVTGALASAINHQMQTQTLKLQTVELAVTLSERLAAILGRHTLSLLGTEQPLPTSIHQLVVSLATYLSPFSCNYCRLVYKANAVVFEAMLAAENAQQAVFEHPTFAGLAGLTQSLGGQLSTHHDDNRTISTIRLQLPRRSADTLPPSGLHYQEYQETAASRPAASRPAASHPDASPLSEREQEVIALLTQGLRDRDIAEKLYISERTVKFHTKNMLTKLGVKTRIQAVFEATKKGWVS